MLFSLVCRTAPVALLALGVATSPALAHSGPGSFGTVKGIITSLNRTSVRIQTATSTVTARIGTGTHVVRVVAGSIADIKSGANVALALVRGTTTVSTITVLAARQSTREYWRSDGAEQVRSSASHPAGGARVDQHPEGQVVSINANSITIRGPRGQTDTYTLSSNPRVNKLMTGHLSDLQLGESIAAQLKSHAAVSITILNS